MPHPVVRSAGTKIIVRGIAAIEIFINACMIDKCILMDYESLISLLIEQRPELTREEVARRVQAKMDKIGSGYLTDQGAVFLVASDIGVTLDVPVKADMGIKDLYSGAKEVSLETRVMGVSAPKQYSRKDGTSFTLRTMTVYDGDASASVKLWDDKAEMAQIENLKPGDLIKIIKAYVKSGLYGESIINIGSDSDIEQLHTDSSIPSIDSIIKDPKDIKDGDVNMAVSGTLEGEPATIRFTDKNGRAKTALKMGIRGAGGELTRAVIWGKDESAMPKVVSSQATVKLYGVRAKQGREGLEIHGDDSTVISIEGQKESAPLVCRVLSKVQNADGHNMIVGVDSEKRFFNIMDAAGKTSGFAEGDVIECMPSRAYGSSITVDAESFARRLDDDPQIPTLEGSLANIQDIKQGRNVCIRAVILKMERKDVNTKGGDVVQLSQIFAGDNTGQIWVNGWREQSRTIDKYDLGNVVVVTALDARPDWQQKMSLTMTRFSKIIPKQQQD